MNNIYSIKTVDQFRSAFACGVGVVLEKKGMTQEELAFEIGCEPRTLRKWYAEEATPSGFAFFRFLALYGDFLREEGGIDLSRSLD